MDTRFRAVPAPAVVSNAAVPSAIARERSYAARNYDPLPRAIRDVAAQHAHFRPYR